MESFVDAICSFISALLLVIRIGYNYWANGISPQETISSDVISYILTFLLYAVRGCCFLARSGYRSFYGAKQVQLDVEPLLHWSIIVLGRGLCVLLEIWLISLLSLDTGITNMPVEFSVLWKALVLGLFSLIVSFIFGCLTKSVEDFPTLFCWEAWWSFFILCCVNACIEASVYAPREENIILAWIGMVPVYVILYGILFILNIAFLIILSPALLFK